MPSASSVRVTGNDENMSSASAFLVEWSVSLSRPASGVASYGCVYSSSRYTDALYEELAIERPNFLQRAVAARRADYLAGRHCAARVLRELGSEILTVPTGEMREPTWPVGISGSISHTATRAIAVGTREAKWLGVDIESLVAESQVESVASRVAKSSELAVVVDSFGSFAQSVTTLFSIKEAFFKAAFPMVRAYFDFDVVQLTSIDARSGEFRLELRAKLHDDLPYGGCFEGHFEWLDGESVLAFIAINRNEG